MPQTHARAVLPSDSPAAERLRAEAKNWLIRVESRPGAAFLALDVGVEWLGPEVEALEDAP